jgi:hypothetical protein
LPAFLIRPYGPPSPREKAFPRRQYTPGGYFLMTVFGLAFPVMFFVIPHKKSRQKWSFFLVPFLDFGGREAYNVTRNIGESILRCVCYTHFSENDPFRRWKKLEK